MTDAPTSSKPNAKIAGMPLQDAACAAFRACGFWHCSMHHRQIAKQRGACIYGIRNAPAPLPAGVCASLPSDGLNTVAAGGALSLAMA